MFGLHFTRQSCQYICYSSCLFNTFVNIAINQDDYTLFPTNKFICYMSTLEVVLKLI